MRTKQVEWTTADRVSTGCLLNPSGKAKIGVVLAHGAGAGMDSDFMIYFHQRIAEAGYPSLRFNFPYMQAGKRSPDPQPILVACFRRAIQQISVEKLVIGGKSMGGRIASYLGAEERVAGLFFLGYPLHPPGKPEQLRDAHLYSIRKSMFFASGTKDPFAREDLFEQTIKRLGKHATTHLIEDGGHSFEVPKRSGRSKDEILQTVCEFLLIWLRTIES